MSNHFEDAFVYQALVIHAQRFLPDSTSVEVLDKDRQHAAMPYLFLELRRSRLVVDVLAQLTLKAADVKKPLKVKFLDGEEGHDAGGVQKEFFQILIAELLDPAYGMFVCDPDSRYNWIHGSSLEPDSHFELVGMVIGLAAYNGVILDVNFPPLLWRKLQGEVPDLHDMTTAFPVLGRGLGQLLTWSDGDVEDVFVRTFEIAYEVYGQVRFIPLAPGGAELLVTNANREQYVRAYIYHYTVEWVRRPFEALRRGFLKVCGGPALKMCRPAELELMVCGSTTSELNFGELERAAAYDDGYSPQHPVIRWFWDVVSGLSLERKKKLLHFVTASDRVPLKGLGDLTFVVQRNGPDSERLPSSLTCFGRLLLPEYGSREKLENRLITAIENSKGFGLV
jgi:ubiquitin-protein ligase E3 A